MSLSVGIAVKGGNTSSNTATTGSGTSQASGSGFLVGLSWDRARTFSGISDAYSNSWTQIGSEINFASGGYKSRLYYCASGSGGASHTFGFSISGAANTTLNLVAVEIKTTNGAGVTFDKTNQANDTSSPYASGATPTTTQAVEMLVAFLSGSSASNPATHAESTGFTIQTGANETNGSNFWPTCLATRAVSSTGAYNCSFTESGASGANVFIATFYETSSGGTTNTVTKDDLLRLSDGSILSTLKALFLVEQLALADSYIKGSVATALTLSDALSLSESVLRSQLKGILASDQVTAIVDAFVKSTRRNPILADSLTLLDESLRRRLRFLMLAEQVSLGDGVVKSAKRNATLSESVSVMDIIAASLIRAKRLDENVLLVDSFTKSILSPSIQSRTLSEGITLFDANVFHDWTVMFSNAASLADEIKATSIFGNVKSKEFFDFLDVRSDDHLTVNELLATEQIGISDFISYITTGHTYKVMSDALWLVDSVSVTRGRTLMDVIALDDTSGLYREMAMIADDDLAMVDEFIKSSNVRIKSFIDTILLTDQSLKIRYKTLNDALLAMSDTFTKAIIGQNVVSKNLVDNLVLQSDPTWARLISVLASDEIAAVIDAFTKSTGSVTNTKNLVDNLLLIDQRIQSRFVYAVKNDPISFLTDNAVTSKLAARWMSETLRVIDSFIAAAGRLNVKVLDDSLLITDGLLKYQLYFRALLDPLTLIDVLQNDNRKTMVFSEAIQIADSTQRYLLLSRQVQDFIASITDNKTLVKLLQRIDSLTLADGQVTFVTKVRSFVEAVFLTDDVRRALNRTTISTDTLALSDEMLARFLPLLQYEVRMKLSVAAKEMALGVDVVTQLRVDPRAMELAVA